MDRIRKDNKDDYVTKEYCARATSVKRWLLTIILTMMGLFVVMTGWSILVANESLSATDKIEIGLAVHQAREDEVEKSLIGSIGELKAEIVRLNTSINALSEKLWRQRNSSDNK